ncbi:spore coat protein [Jeotgalibacillus proteolyticus]|uniref:Spore coat protein n=1 Tax=Jeotgalibacillus proteolyticus TaxID=2082395 RepID=A0A2S5GD27_9BACL|nr:spore coat protein [Jeotgalibacillus proteolyticus]PPA70803.1 spore coat protein [Jeotgalibacillus proteolyticus]
MEQKRAPQHLAWHETLAIHELTVAQSIGLIKVKNTVDTIMDPDLKRIYLQAIENISANIMEFISFYPLAASPDRKPNQHSDSTLSARELLLQTKNSVKSYGTAITEIATPGLREVFRKHLNRSIDSHEKIFIYLYEKGLYPTHDFSAILQNDLKISDRALGFKLAQKNPSSLP